jgi:hypothetical protein
VSGSSTVGLPATPEQVCELIDGRLLPDWYGIEGWSADDSLRPTCQSVGSKLAPVVVEVSVEGATSGQYSRPADACVGDLNDDSGTRTISGFGDGAAVVNEGAGHAFALAFERRNRCVEVTFYGSDAEDESDTFQSFAHDIDRKLSRSLNPTKSRYHQWVGFRRRMDRRVKLRASKRRRHAAMSAVR